MSYIISFDQGTTSSRTIIFDRDGSTIAKAQAEFTQIFPASGYVEHDPEEIWRTQAATAVDAMRKSGLRAGDIAAVGITNQRETTVIWDRRSGEPICNAIVWQDRRTSRICDDVRARHSDLIRAKTGLEVDAYFSASKIKWLLDNFPGARERANNGELLFGTIDTWLIWRLTGGKAHRTDPSNASRTMLFDIHDLDWDDELLSIFDVPRAILPEVGPSSGIVGEIEKIPELRGVKIGGVAGDQQAALFGQACFAAGATKNTYGTGCFMLQNTGQTAVRSENRLLTTIGWLIGDKTEYALEGSVFIGGAVIQWLRDSLKVIKSSADVEPLAASVADNGGVHFVPAFAGLGAPYWDQDARGMITGLTRGTGVTHIARAAVESIAFQTADLFTAMKADSGAEIAELRVDGGATANSLLLQFQADILQMPVIRSRTAETTALGAAYLAGLGVSYWSSKEELSEHWQADNRFEPQMSSVRASELIEQWHAAVARALSTKA